MDNGASVTHAEDHEQAMRVLRGGKGADLLLVDVGLDIRDLVMRLEAEHIHVPIVACGISNDARAAVAAIHAGAKEYIPLPPDPELIAAVLAAVADDSRDLVYRDEAMAKVIKLAQQIAGSDASVMITGKSGTGKEVLARYVHTRSNRAKRPFISINCAAIPEHLLENPNCSATRRARSPVPLRGASESSRRPPGAPCCSTKFPRWMCGCNPNCCGRSRSASSIASAAPGRFRSISASSRPRTATWPTRYAREPSARISCSGSMW